MINKDKINSFEFISLIPFISSSIIMGSGFLYLYNKANKSAIISMVIGFIISIFFDLLIFKVFKTNPSKPLSQKIKDTFPKWIYILSTIIIIIVTFFSGSLVLYRLTAFFYTQFLTDSNKIMLSLVLSLLIFYASTKNIEVLARFSIIALFICIVVYLFNFFTLLPQIEINNMLPIIDASIKDILISSLIFSIVVSGPSLLLLSVARNNISNPEKLKKYLILTYILTATMLLAINICTLGGLGIEISQLYTYPAYIILKKIHVFEFITSIENIAILIWFFFLVIYSVFTFIVIKDKTAEIFKIKNNKIKNLVLLSFIIIGIIGDVVLFSNKTSLDKPDFIYYSVFTYIPVYLLLIIYLIGYKIKKK